MKKIIIEPALILLPLFVLSTDVRIDFIIYLVCVFLHELGHILAAHMLKVKINCMHLDIFGARLDLDFKNLSYKAEMCISFAGPLVNIILCIIGSIFIKARAGDRLLFFVLVNISLALINLIPIRSLDGGRLVSSFFHMVCRYDKAEQICEVLSLICIVCLWTLSVFAWFAAEKNVLLALLCMYLFVHIVINREY